ncbi:TPA: SHOCT domain-containing protein, partial [Clostridioides difficile]|nr:SHOCT domain-containing protein [Clostridioides difficile]HBG7452237.1 SHOCT domain-containing protein [Clostridioides difficile]HBG7630084.1 SHOCT domain-containing protein [Clostridioides difficile]HBH3054666.1 SHOCT domain-containing protein [Clostridioides difficile]
EIVASGKPIKKLTKNDILECMENSKDEEGNFSNSEMVMLEYIGGHPLLNKEEFLFVVVKDNKILFKKSGKKSNDKMIDVFEVSYSEIKSVSIEKEEEVIRRYTATRIALFGPFALAMKKKTVDKKEYLIVECKDFILSFKKNDNVCATIYKKLVEYRKNNKVEDANNIADKNNVIDPLEKIKTLKELLDMGAITEEEFNAKKKELLNL